MISPIPAYELLGGASAATPSDGRHPSRYNILVILAYELLRGASGRDPHGDAALLLWCGPARTRLACWPWAWAWPSFLDWYLGRDPHGVDALLCPAVELAHQLEPLVARHLATPPTRRRPSPERHRHASRYLYVCGIYRRAAFMGARHLYARGICRRAVFISGRYS